MGVPREKPAESGQFLRRRRNGTDEYVLLATLMTDAGHYFLVCGLWAWLVSRVTQRRADDAGGSPVTVVTIRCGGRPTASFALLGYPRSRKNGGHSGGATKCSPVLFHREYPRERPLSESGAAYGARQNLRRAESQ
jgi:hypothetical protein